MSRHLLFIMFAVLIALSCSDSETIEDGIIGDWNYEREVFITDSTFQNTDVSGLFSFNADGSGQRVRNLEPFMPIYFTWDLDATDDTLTIT